MLRNFTRLCLAELTIWTAHRRLGARSDVAPERGRTTVRLLGGARRVLRDVLTEPDGGVGVRARIDEDWASMLAGLA